MRTMILCFAVSLVGLLALAVSGQDAESIDVTVVALDTAGGGLNGTVTLQVYGQSAWTATGSGTWTIPNGATVRFAGTWGGLGSGVTPYMTLDADTTYRMDALTHAVTNAATPGANRIEIVFEPIQVTGVTIDLNGSALGGKVGRQVQGHGHTTAPSPHVWTMANGGLVTRGGDWGGLSSPGSGYLPVFKDTAYTTDALTGTMSEQSTPGQTRIEFVFEPIQVTGVTVDLSGAALGGKVGRRVYGHGNVSAVSPHVWVMANGGRVSRGGDWGGLSSPGSGYLPVLKDTTYTTDALTGTTTEQSTPGQTRIEFVFEPMTVTGVTVDLGGNVLSGKVSRRVYGHNSTSAVSPHIWVMANGGRVSRSAVWGGLTSPSVGYVAIYKDTTYVMDALTGVQTEVSSPGANRLDFVFEPIDVTVDNTDSLGNSIGGDTYFRVFPNAHTARFHAGPSSGRMAHGGKAVYGGRWGGITCTSSGYVVFLKDQTLIVNAVSGETTVASSPGEQGVEVRFEVNEPPTADAGPDRTVEANQAGGVSVTLDGSSSTDDGEVQPLSFSWSWEGGSAAGEVVEVFLPLGDTEVTLTVDDGEFTDTDAVLVTVVDTTPPEIACPGELILEAAVEGNGALYAQWLAAATATDVCDADVDITCDGPALGELPIEGIAGAGTLVTWTATDDSGNASSCAAIVRRLDTMPPDIGVTVTPCELWPPNHKMAEIEAIVEVSDTVDPAPAIVLVSVTSNEPEDATGDGDGHTEMDIEGADLGTADLLFLVRAERAAVEEGRIYTVVYCAIDFCGNEATAEATVVVPHDRGKNGSKSKGG